MSEIGEVVPSGGNGEPVLTTPPLTPEMIAEMKAQLPPTDAFEAAPNAEVTRSEVVDMVAEAVTAAVTAQAKSGATPAKIKKAAHTAVLGKVRAV